MSAHVLLHLLNESYENDKKRGMPFFLSFSKDKFNKSNPGSLVVIVFKRLI